MAIAQKGTWWREHRIAGPAQSLRGITNAGARWVLVGDDGGAPLILTVETANDQNASPAFTTRTPGGSDQLHDVAYVAVGVATAACGDNGVIESSANQGQTWSSSNLAGTPDLYGIVGVSGDALSRFIAVGVNEIWGQNSGAVWSQRWSGSQTYRSAAYRSGQGWVAVGDNGFAAHSPTGGVGTWTAPYSMGIGNLIKVASNNGYFMALDASGYAYRSTSGLSGSWTLVKGFGTTMAALSPIATAGSWAAFSTGTAVWLTTDEGDTWEQISTDLAGQVLDASNQNLTAMACGESGLALVTYSQSQVDFVPVTAPAPDAAFSANPNMAIDAVRRLVTQFRSAT